MRKTLSIFVPIHYGKKSLEQPIHRWADNLKRVLNIIAWNYVDWSHLAQYGQQWAGFVKIMKKLYMCIYIYISQYNCAYAAQYFYAHSAQYI
jgi:hypothetical protein